MFSEELTPSLRAVLEIRVSCYKPDLMPVTFSKNYDNEISPEKIREELVEIRKRGNISCDLIGDEPEKHYEILKVLSLCRELRIQPSISTTGFNPALVEKLINAGCLEWTVSFPFLETTFKNNYSNGIELWNNLLSTLELLKNYNCFYKLEIPLVKNNFQELPELAIFLTEKIQPYIIFFNNLFPYFHLKEKDASLEWLKRNGFCISEAQTYFRKAAEIIRKSKIFFQFRNIPFCLFSSNKDTISNLPQLVFEDFGCDCGIYPKNVNDYLRTSRENLKIFNHLEGKCDKCSIKLVCGGLDKLYFNHFGEGELMPFKVPEENPLTFKKEIDCDIIIPVFSPVENYKKLLNEITEKTAPPYNLIVVQRKQSAAKNRNYGLERAESSFIIMCDDDIADLPPGWNSILTRILKGNPRILAVSARLMNKDGSPGRNSANNYDLTQPFIIVPMIPTACCAFRNTRIRFDERYIRAGFEDTDFFRQLEAKEKGLFVITNLVKVVHLNEEKNSGGVLNKFNYDLFVSKWGEITG